MWGGHIQSCVYVLPPLFHEKEKRRGGGGQKFLKQDIIMHSPFHSSWGQFQGDKTHHLPFQMHLLMGPMISQAPIYQHHLMNTDISQKKNIQINSRKNACIDLHVPCTNQREQALNSKHEWSTAPPKTVLEYMIISNPIQVRNTVMNLLAYAYINI